MPCILFLKKSKSILDAYPNSLDEKINLCSCLDFLPQLPITIKFKLIFSLISSNSVKNIFLRMFSSNLFPGLSVATITDGKFLLFLNDFKLVKVQIHVKILKL